MAAKTQKTRKKATPKLKKAAPKLATKKPAKEKPEKSLEKVLPKDEQIEKSPSAKEKPDEKVEVSEPSQETESEPSKDSSQTEEPTVTKTIPKITSFSQLDDKTAEIVEPTQPSEDQEAETKENTEKDTEEVEKASENSAVTETKEEETTESSSDKPKDKISSDEIKEWLQEVRPDTTKEVEKKAKPNLKLIFVILLLVGVVGIVIGGVYYYSNKVDIAPSETEDNQPETQAQVTSTPAPEATKAEINLSDYSINILNGSGIAGEAGKVADILENSGFNEPQTGNAGSYDHTTTSISLKQEVPAELYEKVKEALSSNYIIEKSDETLDEESEFDVVITVGSQKAEN